LDTFDNGFHRTLRLVFLYTLVVVLVVLVVLVLVAVLAVLVVAVFAGVGGGTVEKQFMGGRKQEHAGKFMLAAGGRVDTVDLGRSREIEKI
jgi:uncharacterized protein involved in cysteine biosynthesis